ncbi:putative 3-phosphoinositide-dependent protein kinase 1 [Blattamonas nauphoetae]|uniref:3-phosphoinositide-dependent protein kinase 1 n=1 Tax=Blattamonas nauphoetae TaxID=2049346 RepID=A0ABQ9YL34_9EUKA|nr:putative 3-phosphoinositide-dependent protein kinase 1 [Blattamonas nauphoetae]
MGHPFSKDDFILLAELGSGSFASVYKVKHVTADTEYALKQMSKARLHQFHMETAIMHEKEIMSTLHHQNVIEFISSFQNLESLFYLLELGCDDLSVLNPDRRLPNDAIQFCAAEVLLGIEYIHSNNVLHRDLKPENIIVGRDGHMKITDFGTAKRIDEVEEQPQLRSNTFVGSPLYVSPETLLSKPQSFPADIWAFGCILYFLHVGHPPFDGLTEFLLFQNIVEGKYSFEDEDLTLFTDPVKDLISKILVVDADKRISIEAMKMHPYFEGIQWDTISQRTHPNIVKLRDFMITNPKGRMIYQQQSSDAHQQASQQNVKMESEESLRKRRERSNPLDPNTVHTMRYPFFSNPYTSSHVGIHFRRKAVTRKMTSSVSSLPHFPLPFVSIAALMQQFKAAPTLPPPSKGGKKENSLDKSFAPIHPSHYPSIQKVFNDRTAPQPTSSSHTSALSHSIAISSLLGKLSAELLSARNTIILDSINQRGSFFALSDMEMETMQRKAKEKMEKKAKRQKRDLGRLSISDDDSSSSDYSLVDDEDYHELMEEDKKKRKIVQKSAPTTPSSSSKRPPNRRDSEVSNDFFAGFDGVYSSLPHNPSVTSLQPTPLPASKPSNQVTTRVNPFTTTPMQKRTHGRNFSFSTPVETKRQLITEAPPSASPLAKTSSPFGIMLPPDETVVMSSRVIKKSAFMSKPQLLVLTSKARMIFFSEETRALSTTFSEKEHIDLATIITAKAKDQSTFTLTLSAHTMKIEDCSNMANLWVEHILSMKQQLPR